MKGHREEMEHRIIAEQAAQWLCDLRQASEAEQARFLGWLKQSPRHIKEFLFADTVWREVGQTRFEGLDLDALIAQARADQGQSNIVPLTNGDPEVAERPPPTRSRWRIAIAASVVCMAAGLLFTAWWTTSRTPSYSTAVGEQRSIRLDDGSLLHMNTHSRVEIRYSEQVRELRLMEGEALFTVQRDGRRPFVVHAGNAVIRALGTQFNVHRRARDITIAVISGAVQITADEPHSTPSVDLKPTRLDAGQEARIATGGKISRTDPDVSTALAWRERRMVFKGETLEAVAMEFNRYNRRQIRVEGEAARGKLLSGTFDADDPDSLILFLRKLDDLEVESGGEGLVIRSR